MKIIKKCSTLNEYISALEDDSIDIIQIDINITRDKEIIFLDSEIIQALLEKMKCDKQVSDFTYDELRMEILVYYRGINDMLLSDVEIPLLNHLIKLNENQKKLILNTNNSTLLDGAFEFNNKIKLSSICNTRVKSNVSLLSESLSSISYISHSYCMFGFKMFTDLTLSNGIMVITSRADGLYLKVSQLNLELPYYNMKVYEFIAKNENILPIICDINTACELEFVKSIFGSRDFYVSGDTQLLLDENNNNYNMFANKTRKIK